MALLEKTIRYDAVDISFISQRYTGKAQPEVLQYLMDKGKTFPGIVDVEPSVQYSFHLFSVEKISFPSYINTDTFTFRLGVFLEKAGKISHVLSGIKRFGYIIPNTFVINGGEVQSHGLYNLHAFSFPDSHYTRLPAPFEVNLHLEVDARKAKP